MSKLNELIAELCPNGVEYEALEKCCVILDKKRKPITKSARTNGEYPYYGANGIQDYVDNYIFDGTYVLVGEDGSVITKRGTPVVTWATGKIWVNNHAHIIEEISGVSLRYLYHFLQTVDVTPLIHGNIPKLTGKDFKNIPIPVPPLPVQEEIVRILDSFTSLTAELQTKLQAELQARQKQYEYYRNQLLEQNLEVQRVPLKTVVKHSCSGGTPKKSNLEYYDNGQIPWIRTQDVKFNEITEVEGRITEKAIQETSAKWIPENCVIVAISGATAGRCAINKIKAATNQHCLNMEIDETKAYYRYVFHVLCSKQTELSEKKQGARGDLNASLILALTIPLPSLEVQKRLANLLDNFDAICSDLNIGLPAEIEARQKQYEYYRDALLSFDCSHSINVERERERERELNKLRQYVFGYSLSHLGDIAINCDSQRKPITSGMRETGTIPYYGASGVIDHVKDYIFDGDYLLVSEDGANLTARVTPIAFSVSGKTWVNNHAHVLQFEDYETRRYVEIYLNSIDLTPYITGAAQPKLNQKNLNAIIIPLPEQEKRKKIVAILDRFDTLCNDLSEGLPAEIEARQKQYEYYRDRLLSFPELTR